MAKDKLLHGITVRVQESDWMSEDLIADWIFLYGFADRTHCYASEPCCFWTASGGQVTENVKAQLRPCNHTRRHDQKLQPRDVVINRPFKAHARRSNSEWEQKTYETTPTGRLERATLTEMCRSIVEAWRCIARYDSGSYRHLNKMEGSEDDFLWHRSDEESCKVATTNSEGSNRTYFD
jgi:hypothetical protein